MRPRTIVIGIDFSEASLRAARWVTSHLADGAELVLVHAVPGPAFPSYLLGRVPSPRAIAASGASALRRCLTGIADSLGSIRTRVEVLSGSPHEALAHVADTVGADLVCVGQAAQREGNARFGATTAVRLLTWTRVPTLVVPHDAGGTPARILAAIDQRSGGSSVLEAAAPFTRTHSARLAVMHVIEPALESFAQAATRFVEGTDIDEPAAEAGASASMHAVVAATLRNHARVWVDRQLANAGVDPRRAMPLVRGGDPGSEIIDRARGEGDDLIVIGRGGDATHAAAPAGSLKVGSTTRHVLWAATCPVLVVAVDASRSAPHDSPRRRHGRSQLLELHPARDSADTAGQPPFPAARRTGRECA